MSFNSDLRQGQILVNADICHIFLCGPQGGMRKSNKTNSLVIISDHSKGTYENRWEEGVFHYTGMELKGEQKLAAILGGGNKTRHKVFSP